MGPKTRPASGWRESIVEKGFAFFPQDGIDWDKLAFKRYLGEHVSAPLSQGSDEREFTLTTGNKSGFKYISDYFDWAFTSKEVDKMNRGRPKIDASNPKSGMMM